MHGGSWNAALLCPQMHIHYGNLLFEKDFDTKEKVLFKAPGTMQLLSELSLSIKLRNAPQLRGESSTT